MTLADFFRENPRAALAFSGGTDSAFLLSQALRLGADVRPYFVRSVFQPAFELDDARRLCEELGAALTVLEADVLADETIAANPPERCYHCKKALFSRLIAAAARDGYSLVIDGTNASDDAADRPGMRALRELGVRSPLRECGIPKSEVRRLSRLAGLFTADKPSYACLATRIPAGTPLTAAALARAERAESALMALGFSDFRVREYHGAARVQLREEQLPLWLEKRRDMENILKPEYTAVFLDMVMRDE